GGAVDCYAQAAGRADRLRPGAPDLAEWALPPEHAWRLDASIVATPEMYTHDWCDPEAFDRWLYENYGTWREQMATKLTLWLEVAADAARARRVPLVLGEGWVGYTPLHGTFEEGTVGAEICRRAVAESARVGAWGTETKAPDHRGAAEPAGRVRQPVERGGRRIDHRGHPDGGRVLHLPEAVRLRAAGGHEQVDPR